MLYPLSPLLFSPFLARQATHRPPPPSPALCYRPPLLLPPDSMPRTPPRTSPDRHAAAGLPCFARCCRLPASPAHAHAWGSPTSSLSNAPREGASPAHAHAWGSPTSSSSTAPREGAAPILRTESSAVRSSLQRRPHFLRCVRQGTSRAPSDGLPLQALAAAFGMRGRADGSNEGTGIALAFLRRLRA
jgi:hypothetical protein